MPSSVARSYGELPVEVRALPEVVPHARLRAHRAPSGRRVARCRWCATPGLCRSTARRGANRRPARRPRRRRWRGRPARHPRPRSLGEARGEREHDSRAVQLELPGARLDFACSRVADHRSGGSWRTATASRGGEPFRPGEAGRGVGGARGQAQAAAGGRRPCDRARPRPRQALQEAPELRPWKVVAEHHPRAGHLDLGEALEPALGQRHLPLDRGAGERLDADLVVSDVHEHGLVACTRARAARIGGLKSTFVVPHSRRPSSTPGSRSSRA